MTQVDVAVTNVADAVRAQAGGAHSIELSVQLEADGLTPPLDLVQTVRAAVTIPLHVIVRPHARDFVYTASEQAVMLRAAAELATLGVDGLVVGGHHADGRFDVALVQAIAQAAPGCLITVHRALDTAVDPLLALQQLAGCAGRILVSGGAATAEAGQATLRAWVAQFGHVYRFVAAGKLTLANAAAIARFTRVQACHTASGVRTAGEVDSAQVRAFVMLLQD